MSRLAPALLLIPLLAGCELGLRAVAGAIEVGTQPPVSPPPQYVVETASESLKRHTGRALRVASVVPPPEFSPQCRGVGSIFPEDDFAPKYVQGALNDELRAAGLYGEDGVALRGEVHKLEFSSGGFFRDRHSLYWKIELSLASPGGRSVSVGDRFEFDWFGGRACNVVSQHFRAAVRRVLHKAFADPGFSALLE